MIIAYTKNSDSLLTERGGGRGVENQKALSKAMRDCLESQVTLPRIVNSKVLLL